MQYTRQQLCQLLHVSNPTLRRMLTLLQLQPIDMVPNKHNVPIYMYDQQALAVLCKHIEQARQLRQLRKAKGIRCRGGCNRYYPAQQLNGSQICKDCRNNKALLNVAYDKKPWLKVLDVPAIQKSITFLQNLLKKV